MTVSLKGSGEDAVTERRTPCEAGGGDWSDAATSQGVPHMARSHQKQRRITVESLQRQEGPAHSLMSDFQSKDCWESISIVLSYEFVVICCAAFLGN